MTTTQDCRSDQNNSPSDDESILDPTLFLNDIKVSRKILMTPKSTYMRYLCMENMSEDERVAMIDAANTLLLLANSRTNDFSDNFEDLDIEIIEEASSLKKRKTMKKKKETKKTQTKKKVVQTAVETNSRQPLNMLVLEESNSPPPLAPSPSNIPAVEEITNSQASPDLPTAMRERIVEMGGHEIRLVIEKKLQTTDVCRGQGRFSIPFKQLKYDFLSNEEKIHLNGHDESGKLKGMDVMIIDPLLRESMICLKKWMIGSRQLYCLMTKWNSFVESNALKKDDLIQLWSFRVNRVDTLIQITRFHIYFAVVKL